jgi:diguanylate cyclase (GGDEF)-like protein
MFILPSPTRILLIEDDEADYLFFQSLLQESTVLQSTCDWEDNFQDGLNRLLKESFDVAFVDVRLGPDDGIELIRKAVLQGVEIPLVVLTGMGNYEIDVQSMEAGASDYLVKDNLTSSALERSIRYSIKQRQLELQLQQLAYTDALTQFLTEDGFRKRCNEVLARLKHLSSPAALMLVDIQRLESIKERYGVSVFQQLQLQISARLQQLVRVEATFGLLTQTRFAVLLENASDYELSQAIQAVLHEIGQRGFSVEDHLLSIGVHTGLARLNHEEETIDSLMEAAIESVGYGQDKRIKLSMSETTEELPIPGKYRK